jgi:hypothetical protein
VKLLDLIGAKKARVGRWVNNRVENSHLPIREASEQCSGPDK